MPRKLIIGEDAVRAEVGAVFRRAGIRGRYIRCGTAIGFEYALPTQRGILRARAWVSPPAEVGGRFGRRLKKRLKKLVKNKAFRAIAKVAKTAASFVPGASQVVTAVDTAAKAAKAIKAARRGGNAALRRALPGALKGAAKQLRGMR